MLAPLYPARQRRLAPARRRGNVGREEIHSKGNCVLEAAPGVVLLAGGRN